MDDKRLVCSEEKKQKIRLSKQKTLDKRVNQVIRCFELKIKTKRLTKIQREQLDKLFVEAKWFYNHVLNIKKSKDMPLRLINSTNIKSVKHFDKDHNVIESKLEVLSSQQKQKIITNMISNEKTIHSLIKAGYQKHGSLRFKSEVNYIPLKQYGISYKFKNDHKVKIQGISKYLFVYGSKQFWSYECDYANANLIRKPDGYYLKVTCCIDKDKINFPKSNNKELGIDFGCINNLIFSDGSKLDCQIEESDRMKRLSRKLNRHQKTRSNNRDKTINKIRREYQKANNKKKEFTNQTFHKLKSYDLIVIQDEQLLNWQKMNHGKKIHCSCLGSIKAKLVNNPNVIVLDKYIPTTKFCCSCGRKLDMKLSDRTFSCECGISMDRDIHAAQNMLSIFHLVDDYFFEHKLLPSERGKVKLAEFKTAIEGLFPKTSHGTLKQENATSLA